MKTRICRLHAKVDLRIEEIDVAPPAKGEVLIAMGAGGICGSDMHYYQDGGFGPIRVQEPIILGHEIAGTIRSLGEGVEGLSVGTRVAVNPSRPCNTCTYCCEGLQQHCLTMRFFGSALRFPHEQGGFRDLMVVDAAQCVPLTNPEVTLAEAACAEPLAVCLHALNRAGAMVGSLAGKRVLVTGAGPIGALTVAALHHAGAEQIVITDLEDYPLDIARQMGATETINVRTQTASLDAFGAGKGHFDLAFECSAAPSAIKAAVMATRPQGIVIAVGVAGNVAVPLNLIVGKEIAFTGTHRFTHEYATAVQLIDQRKIDVRPMVTEIFDVGAAIDAFGVAKDRSRAVKVQLSFRK